MQRGRFHVTTDRGGASQSETKRALLTPDEVMNIREDELLVKVPQRLAARLTQRWYDDGPEVKGRARAKGESWILPLGPERR
jgi:type IV secretory pathway TraG/TraD family ATPase VirD4